jgi:hypothetical protein
MSWTLCGKDLCTRGPFRRLNIGSAYPLTRSPDHGLIAEGLTNRQIGEQVHLAVCLPDDADARQAELF